MKGARLAASALVAIVLAAGTAHATPATYTFTGDGGGTLSGTAFSGPFTVILTADTADIDATGAPFYRLNNIGGSFTEGATTVTLNPAVTLVATADATLHRINFFNATFDNGLGLSDPSLTGYDLSTSFGPVTATSPGTADTFLTPTFNAAGDGFGTSGGLLEFTDNTSLTFSAAVPEPASLTLLGSGLIGLGWLRRRRDRRKPRLVQLG